MTTPFPIAILLAEVAQRGMELEVVEDRLRYRPAERMTPELAERLRAHKEVLLALLLHGAGTKTPTGDRASRGFGAGASDESRIRPRIARSRRRADSPEQALPDWDGSDYPPPGASLGPHTHHLQDIPVICRVHLSDEHEGGYRWEILRCRQPDGDGLLGWAVITDDCYLSIVRERGVVRTLPTPSGLTSDHLEERRR